MKRGDLPAALLQRKAVVYVRQSSPNQVINNPESQRRQYELVEAARHHGFRDVETIDDDLGRTASGMEERPGFDRLLTLMYEDRVGAVLCLDATRLARNGRDWEHLLEVCGFVGARIIDLDGVYDPNLPNDRLLLGMKGSISTFELSQLRARMFEAARAKARRGELRIPVPPGYIWDRDAGLDLDPDERLRAVIREIFARFRRLGSARQVLLSLKEDGFHFPKPSNKRNGTGFDWRPIRYYNVLAILKNPFYAGAYVYGKHGSRTTVVDGRLRKSRGLAKPLEDWEVVIKDHHPGFIDWKEFERNRKQLLANSYSRGGGVKSGRGGSASLVGMLTCARCGHHLTVSYGGRSSIPYYRCHGRRNEGQERCLSFGGPRVDKAVAGEVLRAVSPLAVEAALEAERRLMEERNESRRLMELELEQARYEASLAERRYAACDPDNRLIAARLENTWEAALQRVAAFEARLSAPPESSGEVPDFSALADDLEAAWEAPGTTMRARQQVLRSVIEDIVADVDEASREVVLVIHWRGGRHSQLRVRKQESGGSFRRTPEDVLKVIRSMAGPWSDSEIAATLNRMGMRTGMGNTWTGYLVRRTREKYRIRGVQSEKMKEGWLTMSQAAAKLGVTNHAIRRLIKDGTLTADQAVPQAPWRIRESALEDPKVLDACRDRRPCRADDDKQLSMFTAS